MLVVFEGTKPPAGSYAVGEGRREGSYRHADNKQERQLSTPWTLRQLGLHYFLAVSLCANDLTSLGL